MGIAAEYGNLIFFWGLIVVVVCICRIAALSE